MLPVSSTTTVAHRAPRTAAAMGTPWQPSQKRAAPAPEEWIVLRVLQPASLAVAGASPPVGTPGAKA
jgi:hypothetical protein